MRNPSGKPLPKSTVSPKRGLYGVHEPVVLTPNRTTLRIVQEFINGHLAEPQVWDKESISEEYKMRVEDVGMFKFILKLVFH